MEYWHDLITEKSWNILQKIKKEFNFILIGGWAIYLYTKALKSKDIDIIVDFENLNKIRKKYSLIKNNNLKKYEIKIEEIDIDIYVKNYSKLPLPIQETEKNTTKIESFTLINPEILLILKQSAEFGRTHSEKGQKDRIDIISLLIKGNLNFNFYNRLIQKYNLRNYRNRLIEVINNFDDLDTLGLNVKEYKSIKLRLLKEIM